MDPRSEAIRQALSAGGSNWALLNDVLKTQSDVIVAAAKQISADGTSTVLQNLLAELTAATEASLLGVAILLYFQASYLPDVSILQFLDFSKAFLHKISRKDCLIAHREVSLVASKLSEYACKLNCAAGFILPLASLVEKLQSEPHCLTSTHTNVLECCVNCKMYSAGIQFVEEHEVLTIDTDSNTLSSLDYLKYFYYAGCCFLHMKNYAAAVDHFQQAITLPAEIVSGVVLACINKVKLVSLIWSGKEAVFPRYTSIVVAQEANNYRGYSSIYDKISAAYLAGNAKEVMKLITDESQVLSDDGNLELATDVFRSIPRNNIRKLTKAYASLSIADLARLAGVEEHLQLLQNPSTSSSNEETVRMLREMSRAGAIVAKIDDQQSSVDFVVDSSNSVSRGAAAPSASEPELSRALEVAISRNFALSEQLSVMHEQVLTSREYSQHQSGHRASKGAGVGVFDVDIPDGHSYGGRFGTSSSSSSTADTLGRSFSRGSTGTGGPGAISRIQGGLVGAGRK